MTPEGEAKIRDSLARLYTAPGRPSGTRGLVRAMAEATTATGERIRLAADAPAGVELAVEIVDVGTFPDGTRVGSPTIIEAGTGRPISSGPPRPLSALLLAPGSLS